ncbi:colanic acid biosynthesis glycosyl transferase WcaI [Mucilaginibacter yixingensis]|uniref:Colanic acid biosynthesis glycosyl transferase WcaI n=1 Tax=Mucilaginibacter yixingensis TaxID=1295612 RepID=A0A2T5JC47_9SPHI|nr:WcaI family glycosyltransferase [Mucilaginibacter yixingensis]PTQ99344.1 colanic acid biosynthesis glycosyl transferase WcaI [Mucilaginibacter yixingensis]
MKNKRILLISHNFSPEPIGVGKYNGEMINWLAKAGYDCTVITTFPYYPYWKVQAPYTNRWYKREVINYPESGAELKIYRCPSYIPQNPTGGRRTMQDFSYLMSKFFVVTRFLFSKEKFDLIITIAPPFHLAYLGLMLRNIRGGRLLYHIQDLQIEAARDLNLFKNATVLKVLFKIERNILSSANYASTISDGMISRVKTKVNRDIVFFPNWVDTEAFYPLPDRGDIKQRWGYDKDDLICLYSGAAGIKQGLDHVIDAAGELQAYPGIKFIICTSGPYKDELQRDAEARGLRNVVFMQLQPKEKFNEFLNLADVHLVVQKASAADLVMPSKLSTILAVGGLSVITAVRDTTLYNITTQNDFGYVIEPGDGKILAQKVLDIKIDPTAAQKRANARNYAMQYLNIDTVMERFEKQFLS